MASPKSVLEWCCVTCASYPGVDIKDMSSSFRDGLAFCAIIHKHRPDLIDFSSLSKEDVYQNNKLAFEVAETKLGVPALLDPKDLVSAKVPDCLSVLTYISQLYYFFNRKPCAFPSRRRSSHILKSLTDLETSRGRVPQTRIEATCDSCSQPVQLIQRLLSGGKVYHRSCFRCKICHASLLFDSYTHRSDSSSLICAHHVKDAQTSPTELTQQIPSKANRPKCGVQTGFSGLYSLDGSAITSVPRYTGTQKELVRKTPRADEENSQTDRKEEEDKEMEKPGHPVPAPRQSLDLSLGPVPAPRIRTAQTASSSPAAETTQHQTKAPPSSFHISSPKVKSSHPWMSLVHPGPWTQLPLAPPPVRLSRAKSASNPQGSSNRPKVPPPPNPFEEEEVEDSHGEGPKLESSGAAVQSENSEDRGVAGSGDAEDPVACSEQDGEKPSDQLTEGGPAQVGVKESDPALYSTSPRKQNLPRSLSVPAIPSSHQTNSESACKESPGQTGQNLSPPHGPAPAHGFPLIRRKVQSEQSVCLDDLQKQRRQLDALLEELEQRGVELERNIRGGRSGKDWDRRLTEWISLFHERHVTLHRDKELVYLMKQQRLEDRQADVEYELRCLLNKPETDWTPKDRDQEQQLMDELVTIIEQRNQIISSLDQDVQRQNDQDVSYTNWLSNKDAQKDGLTELKKHKGIPKILKSKKRNHKAENSKD